MVNEVMNYWKMRGISSSTLINNERFLMRLIKHGVFDGEKFSSFDVVKYQEMRLNLSASQLQSRSDSLLRQIGEVALKVEGSVIEDTPFKGSPWRNDRNLCSKSNRGLLKDSMTSRRMGQLSRRSKNAET